MAPLLNSWLALARRQLVKSQLPLLSFINLRGPARRGGRRAKQSQLRLINFKLHISLRFFKTNKATRTKKMAQLVVPLFFLPFKEIAFTKKPVRRKRILVRHFQLRPATFAPIIVGLVGVALFATRLTQAPNLTIPAKSGHVLAAQAVAYQPKVLPASVPTQLVIDKIALSAPIAQVGLNADQSLSVPADPSTVGWYGGSPTPGQLGPAVIDGHLDKVNGIAIFWRLRELMPGDIVEVDRADGTAAKFKVTLVQQFPQDQFPTAQVYGNINYAGLRLITCGGIFNTTTHHYSDNFVVFASLIP